MSDELVQEGAPDSLPTAAEAPAIAAQAAEQLAAAEMRAAENLEGWQRAVAELANARKRFERQRTELRTRITIEIVEELLPIVDDLTLAMANAPTTLAEDDWYKGFTLIPRKLQAMLDRLRVERIEAIGRPFDPHLHNAIMQEPHAEYPSGTVVREFQPGYKLGDDVIRTSVVAVAA